MELLEGRMLAYYMMATFIVPDFLNEYDLKV